MKRLRGLRRRHNLHVVRRHRKIALPFHLHREYAQPRLDFAVLRRKSDVRIELGARCLVRRIQRRQMDLEVLRHCANEIGEIRGQGCVLCETLPARWLFAHGPVPLLLARR